MTEERWAQEPRSMTQLAEVVLLDAPSFRAGIDSIRDKLLDGKIQPYFEALLARHGLSSSEAVQRANLDKDYGRQILTGKRMARRDTYIQLAFALGLNPAETQSMLNFLGMGPIYAVRERDAAILYALQRGYTLMKAQLLLEENGLLALGDAADTTPSAEPESNAAPMRTTDVERSIREARDFDMVTTEVQDMFIGISVSDYFDRLLSARHLTRAQALSRAGIKESIGFQLLSGTRTAKNRDAYLRLALALHLGLDETQQLLKFLKKGTLYALKERDAALLYCVGHGHTLEETQRQLAQSGLPLL